MGGRVGRFDFKFSSHPDFKQAARRRAPDVLMIIRGGSLGEAGDINSLPDGRIVMVACKEILLDYFWH